MWKSQDSTAKHLSCDGLLQLSDLSFSLLVKWFLKPMNIWQSYRQNAGCVILRIRLTRSSSKMKNSPEQWRQREFKVGRTSLVSRLSAFLTEANWWRLIAEWKRLEAERTEGNQYWSARPISESTQYFFFWGGDIPVDVPQPKYWGCVPSGVDASASAGIEFGAF